MFRKVDDFLESYGYLTEGTGKIFAKLTDENLSQSIADGHRTLGHLAWHIVTTVPEMMNRTKLGPSAVDHESTPPRSAPEIADAYKKVSGELVEAVKAKWKDETLLETDDMYGAQWPRGKSLAALVSHEVHHVGQMTVLLRQAGETVPGLYGPAKEEWAQFGMETPPY
ncbi:MAG: DinB family protein [Candidatus Latescibacterota bacterium]|nr:MAG: DinB family protein [Candidatus Latescibacterota bacterium]